MLIEPSPIFIPSHSRDPGLVAGSEKDGRHGFHELAKRPIHQEMAR